MNCYYFSFGSNMNFQRMKDRQIEFIQAQPATLPHYTLTFNKLSKQGAAANIQPHPTNHVEGILYTLDPKYITIIDRFEGHPIHYLRTPIQILNLEAFTYMAQPQFIQENLLPQKEYLQHLLEAKYYLSPEYYQKLINWPTHQ